MPRAPHSGSARRSMTTSAVKPVSRQPAYSTTKRPTRCWRSVVESDMERSVAGPRENRTAYVCESQSRKGQGCSLRLAQHHWEAGAFALADPDAHSLVE